MNTEDKKRLEEIEGDWNPWLHDDEPRTWLIEQVRVEAQENGRLCRQVEETAKMCGKEATRAEIAEARCAELEALFALQRTRMAEATEAWRKATGKHDILPDLRDLLAWLMDRPSVLPEAQEGKGT